MKENITIICVLESHIEKHEFITFIQDWNSKQITK